MAISVETGRTMTITNNIIILLLFCVSSSWTRSQVDFGSNDLIESGYGVKLQDNKNYVYLTQFKDILRRKELVFIELYYEVLCPDCIHFMLSQFAPVLKTMSLYLNVYPMPFGNAKIIYENDSIMIECQHGPDECYGNKLHACAFRKLHNDATAMQYNICLMNSTVGLGSDDEAADKCGKSMDVDSEAIKACAKGVEGMKLLLFSGEMSKRINVTHVPYVLINGWKYKGDDFKEEVCNAFDNPPPPCKNDDK